MDAYTWNTNCSLRKQKYLSFCCYYKIVTVCFINFLSKRYWNLIIVVEIVFGFGFDELDSGCVRNVLISKLQILTYENAITQFSLINL
jgi:hypothetical protein